MATAATWMVGSELTPPFQDQSILFSFDTAGRSESACGWIMAIMSPRVSRLIHNGKILRAIIRLIAVDMMNNFSLTEFAA